ncbi:hypothetical protein IAU60_005540 [Kwoniella sp. DSM 27419]
MSAPDVRKRPRSAEEDERDAKRQKDGFGQVVDGGGAGGTLDADQGQGQAWLNDQMHSMEKLYKEVLVQAALIFQHQSFVKKLGMREQKIPQHMMDRLETTWRSYEGLRRQTEWCMVQSGQQPLKTLTASYTPTSTLSALASLAASSTPPKAIDLPIPSHLAINIDGIGAQAAPHVPLETTNMDALEHEAPVQLEPTIDTQAVAQDTTVDPALTVPPMQSVPEASSAPHINPAQPQDQSMLPGAATGMTTDQSSQVLMPPAPDTASQVDTANVDYSTLGLAELTALINGDSFDTLAGMGLSTDQPVVVNTAPIGSGSGQQGAQDVLASFGLSSEPQPSQPSAGQANDAGPIPAHVGTQQQAREVQGQVQPTDAQAQAQVQAPTTGSMDFDFSQALSGSGGGLDGDYSALAGLFGGDQDDGAQAQEQLQGGQGGDTTALDSIFGPSSATQNVSGSNQPSGMVGSAPEPSNDQQTQDNTDLTSMLALTTGGGVPSQSAVGQPVQGDGQSQQTLAQPPPPATQAQQLPSAANPEQPSTTRAPSQPAMPPAPPAPAPVVNPAPAPEVQAPTEAQALVQASAQAQAPAPLDQPFQREQEQDYGDLGAIDMSDFDFTDAGMGMELNGDEFERLMAEF